MNVTQESITQWLETVNTANSKEIVGAKGGNPQTFQVPNIHYAKQVLIWIKLFSLETINNHRWKSLKLDNSLRRTVRYVFNMNSSAIWTVLQDENHSQGAL